MNRIIVVIVADSDGKVFKREWKATANHIDAIRWTLESEDLQYYISSDIQNITIVERSEK